jgi:hypothetical protein
MKIQIGECFNVDRVIGIVYSGDYSGKCVGIVFFKYGIFLHWRGDYGI